MAQVRGMSLFKKTGLLAFCLFGIIACLASGLTAWTLYERMTEEYISKGSAIATSISGASQEILLVRDAATVQSMIDQYLEIEGVAYVFVVDADRVIVSHTFVPEMPPPLKGIAGSKHGQTVQELEIQPFGRVIDICAPVLAGVAGYVHVGMDKELIMDYFWDVIIDMQSMMLVAFWVCVGILYLVTRAISRPLDQLTEHARKLAAHDFSATIDIRTKDELEVLGKAMQSMGQELALLFSEMESEVDKAAGDLRDNMAYLSAIIDNLADGLLVVDVSGKVSLINPAMREFFDLGDGDYRGAPADDLFPSEVAGMSTGVRTCSEEIISAEIPLSRGRVGKAVGSSIRVADPAEQCLGGVILVRDITREKELDQLKTDFISTVSHELRTPMTSVLGFSKIIKKKLEHHLFPVLSDNPDTERPIAQVRGNMDIIVTEAERLTELINDVLDIARMEAGKVQWRDRQISMRDVLLQSKDSTMGMWKSKGLEVDLDIDEDLPPVYGDFDRLMQVVVNLISNAVKFTESSPITCRATHEDNFILISVADRGHGIRSEELEYVFDKFKQVGDTLTEKPAGTGLGLPICQQIVERHGGRIWAESESGQGSTFHFTIPRSWASTQADGRETLGRSSDVPLQAEFQESPPAPRGNTPCILVVDDDPSLTSYLTQFFEDQGYIAKSVTNGHDAVGQAQMLKPDLITMDIMMPGMDGHETISCLRSNPATQSIPILVISALSGDDGRGGDMSLVKPVDEDQLMDSVRTLLNTRKVATPCMVLGDAKKCDFDGLGMACTGELYFVSLESCRKEIDKGFTGVIFIPAGDIENVPLDELIGQPGISVVILPVHGGE